MVLAIKNKYATRVWISKRQFRQILLPFSLDRASGLVIMPRVFRPKEFTKPNSLLEGSAVRYILTQLERGHPPLVIFLYVYLSSPGSGGIYESAGQL